jgi:hypothetical protein
VFELGEEEKDEKARGTNLRNRGGRQRDRAQPG